MKEYTLTSIDNYITISNIKVFWEDLKIGNPYNTTLTIKVKSDLFCGVSKFVCDIKVLKKFAEDINKLYELKISRATLTDMEYKGRIDIILHKTGHISIEGIVYGVNAIQSLKFEIATDQTYLLPFAKSLQEIRDLHE